MQSLMLILAITTFTYISMSSNRKMIEQHDVIIQTEAAIAATAFAQQLVAEISAHSFDEATVGGQTVDSPGDLTGPGDLGYESGETDPDDIDDYNGQSYDFKTDRVDGFSALVKVTYANTTSPAQDDSSPTYLKRIKIKVTNSNFMADSLTLQYLVSYH